MSNYFTKDDIISSVSVETNANLDDEVVFEINNQGEFTQKFNFAPPFGFFDMIQKQNNTTIHLYRPFMRARGSFIKEYEEGFSTLEFDFKNFDYSPIPNGHPFDDDVKLLNGTDFILQTPGLWAIDITVVGTAANISGATFVPWVGPSIALQRKDGEVYTPVQIFQEMDWGSGSAASITITYHYNIRSMYFVELGFPQIFKFTGKMSGVLGGGNIVQELVNAELEIWKIVEYG